MAAAIVCRIASVAVETRNPSAATVDVACVTQAELAAVKSSDVERCAVAELLTGKMRGSVGGRRRSMSCNVGPMRSGESRAGGRRAPRETRGMREVVIDIRRIGQGQEICGLRRGREGNRGRRDWRRRGW